MRPIEATASPIPILLYHAVTADPTSWIARFAVHPDRFARHLDLLAEEECHALTLPEFVSLVARGATLPHRPVIVTFDDGFADFYTDALPRLAARGVPSTLYVTTGALGVGPGDRRTHRALLPMLVENQIRELDAVGVAIGAHTHTHPQLDAIPRGRARDEIVTSKEILEAILGHEVSTFAYPHGYSDPGIRSIVAEVGFESACAVHNAFSSVDDDRYAISRLTVERDTPDELIRAWLTGEGASRTTHEVYRTKVWRYYRRTVPSRKRAGSVTDLMFSRSGR